MSENETKHELLIPFESFSNRGIQKEKSESFHESFFKDVYYQASEAIVMINESNKKRNNDIDNNINFEQKLYDVQNVIAFTGRRGTGKTSAMLAFVDSLVARAFTYEFKIPFQNTRFYSLPYIDASMLEMEEDVFEIVLSKMLLELNKKISNPYYRDLTQYEVHFNDVRENIVSVYNQYASLKKPSSFVSASSCSIMEKLAEKHDIRSQIVDLMKKYVDCMTILDFNQYANENSGYLIICIDDIDMSQKNHMEVMQSIYQYLMIPNVIVMITLNVPVLSASIEKSFYSKVCVSNSLEQQALNLCREQTYDFLKKIIPFDMRITMPSWRKQDYRSLTSIEVNLGNKDNLEKLIKMFPKLEKSKLFNNADKKFTPKELIMIMIAHRTKTFLDISGDKMHFMQPDSLRNLNDLFYLLYNMNDIYHNEPKSDKYYFDLETNRKMLLNYLYFKMIPEYNFPYDVDQVIKEFSRDNLQRKGRIIWDYYYNLLIKASEKERIDRLYGNKFYENEVKKNIVEYYSFGELFRVLYFGSRLNLMSKNFVKTILASFSFAMPQLIEISKKEEKDRKKKNTDSKTQLQNTEDQYGYKCIRDIFKYTLLGTWCKDLFGDRTIDIVIDNCNGHFAECVKKLICLLMLSPISTGEKIIVSQNENVFKVSAKLDPTAFIMNSVRIERIKNMRFLFCSEKTEYNLSGLVNKIIQTKNKKEIRKEGNLLEDEIKANIPWFMLKNIDLSYNVIKRTVTYQVYRSDNNLKDKKKPIDDPIKAIKLFYGRLIKQLEEEEIIYNRGGFSNNEFSNKFKSNPIVKLFMEATESEGGDKHLKFKGDNSVYISWSNQTTIPVEHSQTRGEIKNDKKS